MDGIGLYSWTDGRHYLGEYKDNGKHGFGILKFKTGAFHQGYWAHGKGNGLGIFKRDQDSAIKYGLWENGR